MSATGDNKRLMFLESEIVRQKSHNRLLEETLHAERNRRKEIQEGTARLVRKFKRLMRHVEEISGGLPSAGFAPNPDQKSTLDLLDEIDPGRLIRSGIGG